jgi:hypothetical protein
MPRSMSIMMARSLSMACTVSGVSRAISSRMRSGICPCSRSRCMVGMGIMRARLESLVGCAYSQGRLTGRLPQRWFVRQPIAGAAGFATGVKRSVGDFGRPKAARARRTPRRCRARPSVGRCRVSSFKHQHHPQGLQENTESTETRPKGKDRAFPFPLWSLVQS